jgi:hypothetical protein
VGLLRNLGFFLGRFLALASTQCNCVAPFWVFLIYTFLLIKKIIIMRIGIVHLNNNGLSGLGHEVQLVNCKILFYEKIIDNYK